MGTDIHSVIEYTEDAGGFSDDPGEPALGFGLFTLRRNYDLFDALGNGRSASLEPPDQSKPCLIAPKGIPADLSPLAAQEYYDLVRDRTLRTRFFGRPTATWMATRQASKLKPAIPGTAELCSADVSGEPRPEPGPPCQSPAGRRRAGSSLQRSGTLWSTPNLRTARSNPIFARCCRR